MENKIKFSNDFTIAKDKYQWILIHHKPGINPKTKEPTISDVFTYHANLKQVANKILNIKEENVSSLLELHDIYANTANLIATKFENIINEQMG